MLLIALCLTIMGCFLLDCVSFKKSSNAQGGQSRVSIGSVSSDSTNAAAAASAHAGQNGAHSQPILHGIFQYCCFLYKL